MTHRRRFLASFVLLVSALAGASMFASSGQPSAESGGVINVGVVLPLPVTASVRSLLDVQAEAARNGAVMGLDDAARTISDFEPRLLITNTPSVESARRAAERLITVDGVVALIGGVGEGQASALSEVAEEHGVLFVNIGDQSDALRETCRPMTFHIEASRSIYLSAMAMELGHAGLERIAVVHTDSGEALEEAQSFVRALRSLTGADVWTHTVAGDAIVFQSLLQEIADQSVDAAVLLLPPAQQDALLLQAEWTGSAFQVRLYPDSQSQSRYALATRRMDSSLETTPRIALWDTNLSDQEPGRDFNERFMSRFAAPADPAAWAAYHGVRLVFAAAEEASTSEPQDLAEYLLKEWPGSVGKPSAAGFRDQDHQLIQDMYLIKVDAEATWTIQVSTQAALATVIGVLDADSIANVDGAEAGRCVPDSP